MLIVKNLGNRKAPMSTHPQKYTLLIIEPHYQRNPSSHISKYTSKFSLSLCIENIDG